MHETGRGIHCGYPYTVYADSQWIVSLLSGVHCSQHAECTLRLAGRGVWEQPPLPVRYTLYTYGVSHREGCVCILPVRGIVYIQGGVPVYSQAPLY